MLENCQTTFDKTLFNSPRPDYQVMDHGRGKHLSSGYKEEEMIRHLFRVYSCPDQTSESIN